jgi:hypothetical protein
VWHPFDNGSTIGQRGSEGGVIVCDMEHEGGARATLERQCDHATWTVTCGVYGWFFHTRFVGSESEADFSEMISVLAAILKSIPRADDPELDAKMRVVNESIHQFVDRFP